VIGVENVEILDYIMSVSNPFLEMMLPPAEEGKCDLPKNKIVVIPVPALIGGGEIKACIVRTEAAYMTSIVIYSGNSGSPMVDFWGRVVGVAFASDNRDHYGDIVSLDDLETFLAKY
jgi:hypothetical protein